MNASRTSGEPFQVTPAQAAEDLLAYAIDRQDIKWCLARLPSDRSAHLARIDTELQIEK